MKLHFNAARVRAMLAHSQAATERRHTFGQLYQAACRRDGMDVPLKGKHVPTPADVDPTKVPPGLWLVGETGIYLMSNGLPLQPGQVEGRPLVAYAEECDPSLNLNGWHVLKRAAFGGDDGCEFAPARFIASMLTGEADGRVALKLTTRTMAVTLPSPLRKVRHQQ